MDGVKCHTADMCMYGMQTRGATRREVRPARKRTRFMSNYHWFAERLSTRCDGLHVHQHLLDGRAKAAARYPEGLCRAICIGLSEAIQDEKMGLMKVAEIQHDTKVAQENISPEHEDLMEGA